MGGNNSTVHYARNFLKDSFATRTRTLYLHGQMVVPDVGVFLHSSKHHVVHRQQIFFDYQVGEAKSMDHGMVVEDVDEDVA